MKINSKYNSQNLVIQVIVTLVIRIGDIWRYTCNNVNNIHVNTANKFICKYSFAFITPSSIVTITL